MEALNSFINETAALLGPAGESVLRLVLAAVLGALIGLEREVRGREAGFRTNLLVALGSALVMLVSVRFAEVGWMPSGGEFNINVDPARIAYGVMTGIGFLGAGAILKFDLSIRGLTTAAGLWCVAAIGLAVGFGMYLVAIATAILVLLALWLLDYVEDVLPRRRFRKFTVRCDWSPSAVTDLVRRFRSAGLTVLQHGFTRSEDLASVDVELSVTYIRPGNWQRLESELHGDPHCRLMASEPQ